MARKSTNKSLEEHLEVELEEENDLEERAEQEELETGELDFESSSWGDRADFLENMEFDEEDSEY